MKRTSSVSGGAHDYKLKNGRCHRTLNALVGKEAMGIELKTMTGEVEFEVVYECDCGNLGTVKLGAQFECCGMIPQTDVVCDECGEVRTVNCEILVEDA